VRSSKNLFFAPLQEKVKKGFKGQKKSIKVVQAKVKKPLGKKKFIALVRKRVSKSMRAKKKNFGSLKSKVGAQLA